MTQPGSGEQVSSETAAIADKVTPSGNRKKRIFIRVLKYTVIAVIILAILLGIGFIWLINYGLPLPRTD